MCRSNLDLLKSAEFSPTLRKLNSCYGTSGISSVLPQLAVEELTRGEGWTWVRSERTAGTTYLSVLAGPLELSSRSHVGAFCQRVVGGQSSSCSQPELPWLFSCFLYTEEALAYFCLDNRLSFMTADKKSWATSLRTSSLKKSWQADVCFSSKSEWKDNIMEGFLWLEKLRGVLMRNKYLAEQSSLVKTGLSCHTLQISHGELWFQGC